MSFFVPPPIPISVVITTKNEAKAIARCIQALHDFAEVVVVDSNSTDGTCDIARKCGAQVVEYHWNGKYPKKRGWCLENVILAHPWVFFVDADEIVPPALVAALRRADFTRHAGYFIRGQYIWNGRPLRFGLYNTKLALFDRRCIAFPIVNDLGLEGMGEMEGHYQPVLRSDAPCTTIGVIASPLLHYACEDKAQWEARHVRYAAWERGMNARNAWPQDPVLWRKIVKKTFRALPCRGVIAFVHTYIWKLGFLDGRAGLDFACARYRYYTMI